MTSGMTEFGVQSGGNGLGGSGGGGKFIVVLLRVVFVLWRQLDRPREEAA